ncbi:hypothetical protein COX97_03330 [Candidatus Pacearchaeota archaeon CG_4_10_14_0_2_um_filter_05_32_18]|nr:MAG: hypothetical protein AUJ62_02740 [Candidatus Pacearchaeota archaeon CG1_02_32_21]PIZ82714.1 MAG: hypothetical protein COX97_03330 [Candidatus Pacearchaeota archaeon CG_4_10_14_0_2_um_filter_05_32_18]
MQKYNLEFLREFTKELVMNSLPQEYKEKKAEVEKINSILLKKNEEDDMIPSIFEPVKGTQAIPAIQRIPLTKENPIEQKIYEIEDVKKEGFFLGKITPMVLDPRVVTIECPAPGRFVIVKTPTKKLSTNITLTKENIDEIINSFSAESRIPRLGGIFKAIVNNMLITAIDSHIGGPRFIINKIKQEPSNPRDKK